MSHEKKVSYFKLIISLFLTFYFFYYLSEPNGPEKWILLDNVNLIFHEAGHTIFVFFGEFLHVIAGSIFQVLVPLSLSTYFLIYRGELFSASLLFFWVGQSIINVSVYIGDALKSELPLLGGESVIHDWNYILSNLNLLQYTEVISKITYSIGALVIAVAAVLCFYFSWDRISS